MDIKKSNWLLRIGQKVNWLLRTRYLHSGPPQSYIEEAKY